MKKIILAATAALCFAGGSFAQENAGGDSASSSAFGDMNKKDIVAGVVAVGVLGAMVANNRGNAKAAPIIDIDPICGAGEELIDGECVPVTPTTTVTTTVTASNTVTSTITNPVTVTATTTTL